MRWMRFSTTAGIPIRTNCSPLFADLFLHYYEADFIAYLIQMNEHRLARSFNLSSRLIDEVPSFKNPIFEEFIHPTFREEVMINNTIYTLKSGPNLDLHLESNGKEKLLDKLKEKRDDFSTRTVNFFFICGIIPSAPAYEIFI